MRFATSKKNHERDRSRAKLESPETSGASDGRSAFGRRRDMPETTPEAVLTLSSGESAYRVPRTVSPPITEEPDPPLTALRLLAGPSGRRL